MAERCLSRDMQGSRMVQPFSFFLGFMMAHLPRRVSPYHSHQRLRGRARFCFRRLRELHDKPLCFLTPTRARSTNSLLSTQRRIHGESMTLHANGSHRGRCFCQITQDGRAQSLWTMLCLPCLLMLILQRWLCGCAGPPISGFTKYRVGSTSRVRRLRWMLLFSLAFASRSPMTTQVLCRRSVC